MEPIEEADASRQIHTHEINPTNREIKLFAVDPRGPFGANFHYRLGLTTGDTTDIVFQNGPVEPNGIGVNGLTNEALLAVVLDRLQGFQTGEHRCRENAMAVTKIEETLHWLRHRSEARVERGVEGTHQV